MNLLIFILLILVGAAHFRISNLQNKLESMEAPRRVVKDTPLKMATGDVSPAAKPNATLKWLSTDWPMKLGAFLLLLACAWLTSYAFINNWISPMGRIVLGIGLGILVLGFGEWRILKFKHQGAIFMNLGGAIILASLFAARNNYNFFTPLTALIAMFAVSVYLALASIRHKNSSLAIVGLLMGGLAPLLTNSHNPQFIDLFSYLFVLFTGTLWLVQVSKSKVLPVVALSIIMFYYRAFGLKDQETDVALIFAVLFGLLFYMSNLYTLWKEKKSTDLDNTFTIGTGLLTLSWLSHALTQDIKSGVMILLGFVFFGLAYLLYRRTPQDKVSAIYLLTGVFSAGPAIATELSGAKLTLAFILGASALLLGIALITKKSKLIPGFSLLLIPSMLLSADSFDTWAWQESIFNLHFLVLLSLGLVMLSIGHYLNHFKNWLAALYYTVGGGYLMSLVWITCDTLIKNPNLHVTVALGIYTVVGLLFNLYGVFKDNKKSRITGAVLIGLVLARLLLVDIWEMALSAKIITFFVIGILLISTAFFNKKRQSSN